MSLEKAKSPELIVISRDLGWTLKLCLQEAKLSIQNNEIRCKEIKSEALNRRSDYVKGEA